MPIIWFIANVGGILGLTMGCSLVTIFEILHHVLMLFLHTGRRSVSKIKKKEEGDDDNEEEGSKNKEEEGKDKEKEQGHQGRKQQQLVQQRNGDGQLTQQLLIRDDRQLTPPSQQQLMACRTNNGLVTTAAAAPEPGDEVVDVTSCDRCRFFSATARPADRESRSDGRRCAFELGGIPPVQQQQPRSSDDQGHNCSWT